MLSLPKRMYFASTRKCDLDCPFCAGADNTDTTKTNYAYALSIMEKIKPVSVGIIGGEPILTVDELIENFFKKYPTKTQTSIYSNGIHLDEENIRKIEPYVDTIKISFDTTSKPILRSMRGTDKLEDIIRGIRLAKSSSMGTTLDFTLTYENRGEARNVVDFARKENIGEVNVIRERPMKRLDWRLTPRDVMNAYREFSDYTKDTGIKLDVHDPLMGLLDPKSSEKCMVRSNYCIMVNNDGSIGPCPYIYKYVKGDFETLWNNDEFFNASRKVIRDEKCDSCKVETCNGGCRASSFDAFKEFKRDPWCFKDLLE